MFNLVTVITFMGVRCLYAALFLLVRVAPAFLLPPPWFIPLVRHQHDAECLYGPPPAGPWGPRCGPGCPVSKIDPGYSGRSCERGPVTALARFQVRSGNQER